MQHHPQLIFIQRTLSDLESLRDAADANGEPRLAAYLRAACKATELAIGEAGGHSQPEKTQ